MAESPIVGVILAAGLSRRLGRPKQLELIEGRPLVSWTVERVLASSLNDVAVITGHAADEIQAAVAAFAVVSLHNPEFASGQASSLVTGVLWAEHVGADAIIVLLADQPGIPTIAIDRLIEARRSRGALLAMTRYGSERSHPVLLGRELFVELLALTGDTGGREVIQRHSSELVLVDGGRNTIPADLDADQDLVDVIEDLHGLA